MINKGIILGHVTSHDGIKVDKPKFGLIAKIFLPTCVKDIRSFLGHVRFYRRFIKDFSTIAKSLTNLLAKDVTFHFFECLKACNRLKEALTFAQILHLPI